MTEHTSNRKKWEDEPVCLSLFSVSQQHNITVRVSICLSFTVKILYFVRRTCEWNDDDGDGNDDDDLRCDMQLFIMRNIKNIKRILFTHTHKSRRTCFFIYYFSLLQSISLEESYGPAWFHIKYPFCIAHSFLIFFRWELLCSFMLLTMTMIIMMMMAFQS